MAEQLKQLLPTWTYDGAENAVCSGVCLAVPCFDRYAPNVSGCCCMPLTYTEQICDFDYFFEKVVPNLHTGDVFLTSWPAKPGEWAQTARCMMRSRWTHVGMIYRPTDSPILHTRDRIYGGQTHDSRPLIAQMLVYGEMGFRDGQGFEMVDLEVWVKDYLDKYSHSPEPDAIGQFLVGVRFLTGVERDDSFYKAVQQKVDDYWLRPYELQDTMMAAVDLCECIPGLDFTHKKGDDSSVFCSELVAEVYKAAGLLDPKLSGNEFIPRNFDTTSMLWLKGGARLSREFVLLSPMTEKERNALGYKNRGTGDPLSKDKFGPGGFWGVDTMKPIEIGWGVPGQPAAPPAPTAAVDPVEDDGTGAAGAADLPAPTPAQVMMGEAAPPETATEPARPPPQVPMEGAAQPEAAADAGLDTPLLNKA